MTTQHKRKTLKLLFALSSGVVITFLCILFLAVREYSTFNEVLLALPMTFAGWSIMFFKVFRWYGVAYLVVTSLLIAWLAKIWWVAEECRTFKYIVLSGVACFFWSVFGVAFCLIPIITYFIPDYIRII